MVFFNICYYLVDMVEFGLCVGGGYYVDVVVGVDGGFGEDYVYLVVQWQIVFQCVGDFIYYC